MNNDINKCENRVDFEVNSIGDLQMDDNWEREFGLTTIFDHTNVLTSPQTKAIEEMEKLVASACSPGQWNFNEYLYGMANGLILALAVMKDENPQYLDRPERWLCDHLDDKTPPPSGAASEYGTQPEPCGAEETFWTLPEVQESLRDSAAEFARTIDDEIIAELIGEGEKLSNYERAMKWV